MPIKENRKNAKISIVLYCIVLYCIPRMDTRFVRQNNSTYKNILACSLKKSSLNSKLFIIY